MKDVISSAPFVKQINYLGTQKIQTIKTIAQINLVKKYIC